MSAPPGAGAGADGQAREIRLHGLVKSFKGPDGPIEAVRGVDIEIAIGETVALLGPNGAGKSTTIDMLLGLLAPDAGGVSVFGRSPSDAVGGGRGRRDAADGLADPRPDGARADRDDGRAVPRPAGRRRGARADGHAASSPSQRTQKLSGGQTQRVRVGGRARQRTRSCSCSTSRRSRWTSRAATRSGARCASSRRAARRSCSRRTTSRRPTPTPTAPC